MLLLYPCASLDQVLTSYEASFSNKTEICVFFNFCSVTGGYCFLNMPSTPPIEKPNVK